jgi:hypothetical protein
MNTIEFTFSDAAKLTRDVCLEHEIYDDVATCMILKRVLEQVGYSDIAYLSTRVLIFNPYITKEFKPGKAPSQKRLNYLLSTKNGHSIILGSDNQSLEWSGHLILLMRNLDGVYLFDPTLDISFSSKKIVLNPLGVKVDDNFGSSDNSRTILKINDCAVMYSGFPSDSRYEQYMYTGEKNEEFKFQSIVVEIYNRIISGVGI